MQTKPSFTLQIKNNPVLKQNLQINPFIIQSFINIYLIYKMYVYFIENLKITLNLYLKQIINLILENNYQIFKLVLILQTDK